MRMRMHVLITLCFVSVGYACKSYFTEENQQIPIGCVPSMYLFTPWEPQDIDTHFIIHDRGHLENPQRVLRWNASFNPNDPLFNAQHQLKFIIHGYTESGEEPWIQKLRDVLIQQDPNTKVITVDWSQGAYFNQTWYYINRYFQASSNALMVARLTACLVQRIMSTYGIPETSVHIIGHSIGAQIMGRSVSWLSEKFGIRIASGTALDAASPIFDWKGLSPQRNDVRFMLSIHTSVTTSLIKLYDGAVGVYHAFADVDLYPNRGTIIQPACRENNFYFCSHRRAYIYLTDMLTNCNERCDFQGNFCRTEREAVKGLCSNRSTNVCAFISDIKASKQAPRRPSTILTFDTNMDQLYMRCIRPEEKKFTLI